MLTRLKQHLSATSLIPEGAAVLIAYSGGPDSTCLLHLLKAAGIDVIAAHLHHGQRAEADKEEALCKAFCDEIGVPFVGGRADVPKISKEMKIGLEEAGRKARYQFLRNAAFRTQADLIATGHTRDDHIETVLMHLARGSGLRGLAGIPAARDGIVRPLLIFSRAETQSYCLEQGLWTHDDPANTDLQFSRARIRHNVVPELRMINPGADEAIARLADSAGEEDRFLDGMAAAALEQSEIPLNGELQFLTIDCEAAFEIQTLLTLPPVLFRRCLRLMARAMGQELDHDQTASLLNGVLNETSGSITAEGGDVVIEWGSGRIHARDLAPTAPFRYPLTVPGATDSDEFGWSIEARKLESAPVNEPKRAALEAQMEASKVKGSLYFRSAEDGDRIQPLGFEKERKVSDLFSEAKLTLAARRRMPIICDILGPVWIPGVCLSERIRVSEEGVRAISLKFTSLRNRETTTRV
jgi:tRNA(Ile)-lysidine synthase